MKTTEDRMEETISKVEAFIKRMEVKFAVSRLRVITSAEMRVLLGVSRRTLYDYRVYMGMPHTQIKGRIYYEPAKVEKWIALFGRQRLSMRKKKRKKSWAI